MPKLARVGNEDLVIHSVIERSRKMRKEGIEYPLALYKASVTVRRVECTVEYIALHCNQTGWHPGGHLVEGMNAAIQTLHVPGSWIGIEGVK